MHLEYIRKIKENTVFLFSAKTINGKIINTAVFWNEAISDYKTYKNIFLQKMCDKKKNLILIRREIEELEKWSEKLIEMLQREIDFHIETINFLILTYDIEANKLDPNYLVNKNIKINYDHYNNLFFWVDKSYLENNFNINLPKEYNIYLTKAEVKNLLDYAKTIRPEIKYDFWDYPNLAFNGGLLKIHDTDNFHIKDVISLFFHEMIHFFRFYNTKRNLGFFYSFSDYPTLEEWIAMYNEFEYGNKIIDYWEKVPDYDLCLKILLEDINEDKKFEKIKNILKKVKWYDEKKSKNYYNRFYRFATIPSKNLYLKDTLYTTWYNKVKDLIKEDKNFYEKILAWRVWIRTVRENLIPTKNNLDSKDFFDKMEIKLKEVLKDK